MATPSYISHYKVRQAVRLGFDGANTDELGDDTDFFSFGLDSGGVVILRGRVRDLGYAWVDNGIIYHNSTINTLTERLRRGENDQQLHSSAVTMFRLIDKYSNFPTWDPAGAAAAHGNHVLVTGATGALGAHIVAKLIANPDVTNVYCLVRPGGGGQDANDRVVSSLRRHLLPLDPQAEINPDQRAKIIAYRSNLARDNLGLADDQYNTLQTNLTAVIHCAWNMNYEMQLTSFEDLIRGSSNLISLCLTSTHPVPTPFHFASSISAAPPLVGGSIQETLNSNPTSLNFAIGYAQSKYVVEHLCNNVVQSTPDMRARVHRLGYLVGDTIHGRWNQNQEYPLVLRSLEKINLLPSRPLERVCWLPVDDAAAACIELMFSTDEQLGPFAVFNVAHPLPISWDDRVLAGVSAAGHVFTRCPSREWVAALAAADPAYRLLEFLKSSYSIDYESLEISTAVAERCSPHLRNCPAVTVDLVRRFVEAWNIIVAAAPDA